MSDLLQISKPTPEPAPLVPETVTLPHTVELPTRYYGRLAIEETARAFHEIAEVDSRVGDGVIAVTFRKIDPEAGDVIAEFLNHALFHSATSQEEANR